MTNFYPILRKTLLSLLLTCFVLSYARAQSNGIGGMGGFQARGEARALKYYKEGRADGKKMKTFLGTEVGVFFSFADRNYTHIYTAFDANGVNRGEATYTRSLKNRIIGFHSGSYAPLAKLGGASCLAFDFQTEATFLKDNTGNVVLTSGSKYSSDIFYWEFALPLCLDFKYGGEATYNKADAFSFTLGAGIRPYLGSGALMDFGRMSASVCPVLKAEVGFFAGIEWKITAAYVGQSGNVLEARSGDPDMESAPEGSIYTISTAPSFTIGLSMMPFSRDWDDSGW